MADMTGEPTYPPRRSRWRTARWLGYLVILIMVVIWKYVPRPWKPDLTLETPHYHISSTASAAQTEEVGRIVEMLYRAYANRFASLPTFRHDHPKLRLLLYRDRREFRWVNPNLGWAEAFYQKPYCRAYYSSAEINSYHWMLHEAAHQLNHEVAQLKLAQWLEEGIATYFSTSRIKDHQLMVGRIDSNAYPVWWLDEIATTPDLQANLSNGSVISLKSIINNKDGPNIDRAFNLYYLHWWTLAHFIFERWEYRDSSMALMQGGGGLEAFEQTIGSLTAVELDWHRHIRRIKAAWNGNDLQFHTTGQLPPD